MHRSAAILVLLTLTVSAVAGTAVLPLDPGEWLSVGLAVWLARALDAGGIVAETADSPTAPGDLAGMNRAAAADGYDRLLVVNCGYLGDRVTVELFLFDTAGGTLAGFWRGLVNYDALPRELPSGLRALFGDIALPEAGDPAVFLDDRRADFAARFGG
jgi:hypothetical protein